MAGRHNALNATAAIAVAHELGLSDAMIRKALASFGGVRRRFTKTGEWNGVTIIDDYGHHPVEIAAVLKAARESTNGKIVAVVQPHRFTRLQSLFEEFCTCFNDADTVVVAEVYPAGEAPIAGIDRDHFVLGLRAHGHREVIPLQKSADLARVVHGLAGRGDFVVCLGAGNITQWAYALPGELKALGCEQVTKFAWPGFPDITPDLKAAMPQLRGRLLANQSLAELTWFRVGGPAQLLFTPSDEDDLAYFLEHLPNEIPVHVVGVGSNLIVRDGGMPGVVIRLGPRGFGETSASRDIVSAGAAALDKRVAEAAAAANIGGLEFLLRHSRHHRRRAAHERRRQWL